MAYTLDEVPPREEMITPEGVNIVRTFMLTPATAAARIECYDDLVGVVKLRGGRLYRVPPARDPVFKWAFVRSVKFIMLEEDVATMSSVANALTVAGDYDNCKLQVEYSTRPFGEQAHASGDDSEIELATFSWEFSSQNIVLQYERYGWEGDSTGGLGVSPPVGLLSASNLGVVKTVPKFDLNLERQLLPQIPVNAILQNLGRTNKSEFKDRRATYAPETLRLDSARASQRVTNKGFQFFNMSYKFACFPTYDTVADTTTIVTGQADPTFTRTTKYVGWNRFFDARYDLWRYAVVVARQTLDAPRRTVYQYDEDAPAQTLGGKEVKGFKLLFHPYAT